MIQLCHLLIQNKSITLTSVTEIFHSNVIQCQQRELVSQLDFNEASEFICEKDDLDLFNFEPGILHFQPSVVSLHLGNQFRYLVAISGNCSAFLMYLFIHSFSSLRRLEEMKTKKSTVELMFSLGHAYSVKTDLEYHQIQE